ncbi:MAG: RNA polymerase sigma factor [Oscillospiraceae bacterium]|nr:RNA polymerase sigma factor [Oscillospiraceae bacterium]
MNDFKQDISVKELFSMYSDMIYRIAFARTGNRYDAEDIMENTFLKYIKCNKKFREEEHRKAWLLKVTVNSCNSFFTSGWSKHRAQLDDAREISYSTEFEKSEVYYAVAALPEKYRVVVHLFYYEEMSIEEICEILGAKESTVKSQLHRAREKLKEILKEEQYEF